MCISHGLYILGPQEYRHKSWIWKLHINAQNIINYRCGGEIQWQKESGVVMRTSNSSLKLKLLHYIILGHNSIIVLHGRYSHFLERSRLSLWTTCLTPPMWVFLFLFSFNVRKAISKLCCGSLLTPQQIFHHSLPNLCSSQWELFHYNSSCSQNHPLCDLTFIVCWFSKQHSLLLKLRLFVWLI